MSALPASALVQTARPLFVGLRHLNLATPAAHTAVLLTAFICSISTRLLLAAALFTISLNPILSIRISVPGLADMLTVAVRSPLPENTWPVVDSAYMALLELEENVNVSLGASA